jgi:hypothetical protein
MGLSLDVGAAPGVGTSGVGEKGGAGGRLELPEQQGA